jgi:hypothetical protein
MGLFYDRIEKPDRVVIRYSRILYYYVLILGLFAAIVILPAAFSSISYLFIEGSIWLACLLLLLAYFIDVRKPSAEVRKAMKEGKVLVSGSKFSLSNPTTVEILKKTA